MSLSHAGADPEIRHLVGLLEDRGPDASPAELRDAFRTFVARIEAMGRPRPAVAHVADTAIDTASGQVPVRLYEPEMAADRTEDCFVFLHGGGWSVGDLDTADLGARALAAGLAMRVVSVHYRLAPEHPFPAPFDDCLAVLSDLRGRHAGALYVGGESAGANLSAGLALACRDRGLRLAGQFLINPSLDHQTSSASHRRFGSGEGLTSEAVRRFLGWYAGRSDIDDPRISPLSATRLEGAAPCFVVTAGHDPLLDDGVAYAQRLIAAGVPTVYLPMPQMMHAWWVLLTASEAASANLTRMIALARGFIDAYR